MCLNNAIISYITLLGILWARISWHRGGNKYEKTDYRECS